MDIFSRIFVFGGAIIGAIVLIVALMVLSNAEDGLLTVEGLQHMEAPLTSFYEFFRWFVYPWMGVAIFIFIRFLFRLFGRG
ncbi:MAG: hypothetical protein GXO35_05675 [Gammaproteobacteria bacterium]|nr:hypothetical protein [Gammaproteobacteria bacterium]